ncbi:MAG: histidine kinase [Bacteroidota bacterium]
MIANSDNDSLLSVYNELHNEKAKTLLLLKISEPLIESNIDTAIVLCKEAKIQAEKLKDDSLELVCCGYLVWAYTNKPYSEDSALTYIPLIEKLILKNYLPDLNFSVFTRVADAYRELHQYPNATIYYQKAAEVAMLTNETNKICIAKLNLGEIYRKSSLFDQGMEVFKEAAILAEKNNTLKNTIGAYRGIGICYDLKKDYDNSAKYFKMALDASLRDKEEKTAYSNYGNYSVALGHLKKYDEAIASVKKAVELGLKYRPKDVQTDYKNLAEFYMNKNELDSAVKYCHLSLAIAEKTNQQIIQAIIHRMLADINHMKGNYQEAFVHLDKYKIITDSLNSKSRENTVAEMEAVYENKEKKARIELLNKESDIKTLRLQQKEIALHEAALTTHQKENEITLLNKAKEISKLTLSNTQQQLLRRELEAKTQQDELELMQKNKLLSEHELSQQKILRNGLLAGLLLLTLIGILFFNRFQLRKKIEHQQSLLNERKRISNELHDDLGSGLSTIRFLSEMAKSQSQNGDMKNQLEKISNVSSDMVDNMRQIVWTMNADENTVENLILDLKKYVNDYLETNNLALQLQVQENFTSRKLAGDISRNIFLVVKECLHNTVKHAGATEVSLIVTANEKVKITLRDNGKGFNIQERKNKGKGLSNMNDRMQACNGTFEIENKIGTTVTLTF